MDFTLLKKISETPGAPGFEKPIRDLIIEEVKSLVDSVSIDNMGNLVVFRQGKQDKRVMVAAHMDEIGFIVKHIDDEGFVHFLPLGGYDPKTLTAQRVIVHGREDLVGVMGSKPIHLMNEEEKKKPAELKDYYIDLGMPREEVEKHVNIGNPITRERECIKMGHCVNGKSLDNRVSVYILIECLKQLKGQALPYDLYGVFTVQEEVGVRGVQVAALQIQPNFGFALDTTIAFDVPGAAAHEKVTSLGKGAGIKIMDGMTIADQRMVQFMKETAGLHGIPWQPDISDRGGTDTAGVQRMVKSGSIAGAISLPTRHIHQVIESVHTADVDASTRLLSQCILGIEGFRWGE
jgi:endoglucanase